MDDSIITTENNARSNSTTNSSCLNLFFKTVRDTPLEQLHNMLSKSYAESPLDTLKIIFHLRDCRGGKGERRQFHECLRWLIDNGHSAQVEINIRHISFYGTFKDLFALCGTVLELPMLKYYAAQLCNDIDAIETDNVTISLAAKWAPSENSSRDKKHNIVAKLIRILCDIKCITNKAEYRKNLIAPLRKHLDIVESHMCQNDWENINFRNVPSVAMKLYRKSFQAHQESRFSQYISDVNAGRTKINSAMVYPHQLVEYYLHSDNDIDDIIEAQWKSLVSEARGKFNPSISIVDVSGSMWGLPMTVAIALGLLLAEITEGYFNGYIITFSASPQLVHIITNTSLKEKVNAIKRADWGITTDLMKVFDLILNTSRAFNVNPANMPKSLYIFSDMQFDQACPMNSMTNFEIIEKKYVASGYQRPNIIFWNLRGDTIDFPVEKNVPGTALVSGFSQSLLKLFTNNEPLSPYKIMRDAIDDPRYDRVKSNE